MTLAVPEGLTRSGPVIWTPDRRKKLAEDCFDNWPKLMYDGFGIMVSPEQEEAFIRLGGPGPRQRGEDKTNWLSGGQRAGKTVFAFGCHADAGLYKRGLDGTDRQRWNNYQYATLAIAPTNELTLRLWTIIDEISKGVNEAQYDRKARRARGGAFLGKIAAGKAGEWPIVRFSNGSRIDFRSSEGRAYRLEGGQWWFATWDEWASQPEREIKAVWEDVLMGRVRDHDAKIMPMAWPKAETERHLIAVIRGIQSGRDKDSQVIYMSARKAPWTNKRALAVELRAKDAATIKRTIDGEPAGGAALEFKDWMTHNMWDRSLPPSAPREEQGFRYFSSWDLGLGADWTVGHTFRIPIIGGRPMVSPTHKARIVNEVLMPGGPTLSPDTITYAIAREQAVYASETAVDATGMGGLMAVRQLRDLKPSPYSFKSRSNDRIWGNMRLAAITNALDVLSWGRPPDPPEGVPPLDVPWGLIEAPFLVELSDQLANFDRDAKDVPDDIAWSFIIGCWYIRRFFAVGNPKWDGPTVDFDVRAAHSLPARTGLAGRPRSRLIQGPHLAVAPSGVRMIQPPKR